MTISDALDRLYRGERPEVVTMRQFLAAFSSNSAAAAELAGTSDKRSKEYKVAIRNVQRYNAYIAGERGKQTRNPDNVTRRIMRRATTGEGRREAARRGIRVKEYRGRIKTSPKRRRGKREGSFEQKDENRTRTIKRVQIGPDDITPEILDGDTRAFSDALLAAYGAGEIGELYDIERLELEYGDDGESQYPY